MKKILIDHQKENCFFHCIKVQLLAGKNELQHVSVLQKSLIRDLVVSSLCCMGHVKSCSFCSAVRTISSRVIHSTS